jgi:predicted RNA-binding protein with PIN domain
VTVIFDAADAPPGLPARYAHEGIDVRFAREHGSADALIEAIIEAHDSPTALTVVSADHRVMAAARRRRARPVASAAWFAELRAAARAAAAKTDAKPPEPQSEVEVNRWLEEFGL